MAAEWYYDADGQTGGPITTSQLKQMASGGKLLPKHKVKRGTDPKWFSAERVQGLFAKPAAASTANSSPPVASAAIPVAEAVEYEDSVFGALPPVPPSEQGGQTFAFFSQFTGTPAAAAPGPGRAEVNPTAFDFLGAAKPASPPPPPKSPPPAAKPVAKAAPAKSPPPPPPPPPAEELEDPFGLGSLEGPPVAPPPPPPPVKSAKPVGKSSKPASSPPPPTNIFEDDPFAGLGGMPAPATPAQSHHDENPFAVLPVTTTLPPPKEGKEAKGPTKPAKEAKETKEADKTSAAPAASEPLGDDPFGFIAPTDAPAPVGGSESFVSGSPVLPIGQLDIEQLWAGRVVRVLPDGRPFVESSPAELVLRGSWVQWKAVEIGGRERLVCLRRSAIEMVSLDTSPDGISTVILQAGMTTIGMAPNDPNDAEFIMNVLIG